MPLLIHFQNISYTFEKIGIDLKYKHAFIIWNMHVLGICSGKCDKIYDIIHF